MADVVFDSTFHLSQRNMELKFGGAVIHRPVTRWMVRFTWEGNLGSKEKLGRELALSNSLWHHGVEVEGMSQQTISSPLSLLQKIFWKMAWPMWAQSDPTNHTYQMQWRLTVPDKSTVPCLVSMTRPLWCHMYQRRNRLCWHCQLCTMMTK